LEWEPWDSVGPCSVPHHGESRKPFERIRPKLNVGGTRGWVDGGWDQFGE